MSNVYSLWYNGRAIDVPRTFLLYWLSTLELLTKKKKENLTFIQDDKILVSENLL